MDAKWKDICSDLNSGARLEELQKIIYDYVKPNNYAKLAKYFMYSGSFENFTQHVSTLTKPQVCAALSSYYKDNIGFFQKAKEKLLKAKSDLSKNLEPSSSGFFRTLRKRF